MSPMLARTSLTFVAVLGLFFAPGAAATVTVDLSTATVSANVGDTFDVDVLLTWDGAGSLVGMFSSHQWDNGQLQLINAVFPAAPQFETKPVPLKGGGYDPALTRFGTIAAGIAGDDLSSTARTVSYGSLDPLNGATSAMTDELITRLTFEVIGAGDGVAEIVGVILKGDLGADGDDFAFGPDLAVTVPEPASALLALSSLAAVMGVIAVRRRA